MSVQPLLRVFTVAALSMLGACIPEYHPPTLSEPHATIKIRRTYDTQAGVALHELLLVDGHSALRSQVPARLASAPRIDASLVHPKPATFTMLSSFFHQEMRQVSETYYEQESYSDYESYDCSSGYGSSAVHRSCSRSVTRYRSIPRQRTVSKLVDVTDAECRATNRFTPAVGRVYLLQYSFQEHAACSLSCFEQVPNSDGTFTNAPCPPAPPPQ
ncbi:MAG: hypothetical protein ABW061_21660 [Polyangiaceae bacterium]